MVETRLSYPQESDPEIFLESLRYSEASTGVTASLIERDYFSSLILRFPCARDTSLVFKGGTCIRKVYADFYRLSEDLDFLVSVPCDASRNQRRAGIEPVKHLIGELPIVVPGIRIEDEFKGHNESRQYIGYLLEEAFNSVRYLATIIDR